MSAPEYKIGSCDDCVDGCCTMNCSSAVLVTQKEHLAASMWSGVFPAKATATQVLEYRLHNQPAPENPFAFPFPETRDADGCGIMEGSAGMTLRDWFSGQALAEAMRWAFTQTSSPVRDDLLPEEWAAKIACGVADAMLAERAKGGEA